jgi:hypothetical protein
MGQARLRRRHGDEHHVVDHPEHPVAQPVALGARARGGGGGVLAPVSRRPVGRFAQGASTAQGALRRGALRARAHGSGGGGGGPARLGDEGSCGGCFLCAVYTAWT